MSGAEGVGNRKRRAPVLGTDGEAAGMLPAVRVRATDRGSAVSHLAVSPEGHCE